MSDQRQELSPEEVKAQREKKKAERAALVAAKKAQAAATSSDAPSADGAAAAAAPPADGDAAPGGDDKRQELSPEEVKAQREKKKAERAALVAAKKAHAAGGADAAATPETEVPAEADGDKRQELSPEEVKAQREKKKAERAALVAAKKAQAAGGGGAEAPATPADDEPSQSKAGGPSPKQGASPAPSRPTAAADGSAAAPAGITVPPDPARSLPKLAPCDVSYEFAQLGHMCRSLRLVGANARTMGMLRALLDLVKTNSDIARLGMLSNQSVERVQRIIKTNTDYLASCRGHTAGMEFVLNQLRERLHRTAARHETLAPMSVVDVASQHIADITSDVQASITDCANEGVKCINNGDVILTYGRSSTIEHALALAAANGVDFTVVIADSAPLFEGRGLQWRLQQRGIKTGYVLLTAVCTIMPRITRVFIGAASILQNGQVVGRAGTAVVSLVAKQFRRPLICFCESYKFTERIWRAATASLDSCQARYDCTPKDLVDHVVSEIGYLHPTAIAAAIRDRDDREARTQDPF